MVSQAGFDPNYYTAENDSFDLPYDSYSSQTDKGQIKLIQKDGSLSELSAVSPLVLAITGKFLGDKRFFFPKEMLGTDAEVDLLVNPAFRTHLKNDHLI